MIVSSTWCQYSSNIGVLHMLSRMNSLRHRQCADSLSNFCNNNAHRLTRNPPLLVSNDSSCFEFSKCHDSASHYLLRTGPRPWSNRFRRVPDWCEFLNARDTSRQGKFMKLLRIEIENYPIIMTMGMYRIKSPWISLWLIHTYQTKYRYWYA
jgi:hypothetical protein